MIKFIKDHMLIFVWLAIVVGLFLMFTKNITINIDDRDFSTIKECHHGT